MLNFMLYCVIAILAIPGVCYIVELFRRDGFWASIFWLIGFGLGSIGLFQSFRYCSFSLGDLRSSLSDGPVLTAPETVVVNSGNYVSWGVLICMGIMIISFIIAFLIRVRRVEKNSDGIEQDTVL